MAYSTDELLLAAKVFEMAVAHREDKHKSDRNAVIRDMFGEKLDAYLASLEHEEWTDKWLRDNPLLHFQRNVLAHIKKTADFIARTPSP